MKNNYRSIAINSLALTALFLVAATVTLAPALGSSISLSGFSVTPAQASLGMTVTGSVTVHNLDTANAVTVSVTFSDGGLSVGSSSPTVIAKGDSATISLSFKTATSAPHCYAASATPGSVTTGYCETGGHLLGGTSAPVLNLTLTAATVSLASVAAAGMLLSLRRRRAI